MFVSFLHHRFLETYFVLSFVPFETGCGVSPFHGG